MTVREAVADLWDLTGELSDLDPFGVNTGDNPDPETDIDPASYGVRYFLRHLSEAQYKLANWKTNRRLPIRFRQLDNVTNILVGLKNPQVGATKLDDPSTLRINKPISTMVVDDFEEARVDITITYLDDEGEAQQLEETKMVVFASEVSDTAVDVTFREDIEYPANVQLVEANVYFKKFRLAPRVSGAPDGYNLVFPNGVKTILKITDLTDGTALTQAMRKDDLVNSGLTTASPVQWFKFGQYIYFDSYVEDPRWLRFEYIRHPKKLVSVDDSFDIPEEWHDILKMIAMYHIDRSRMENEKSQITKSDIDYWISRKRLEEEDEELRETLGGFYPVKE